MEIQFHLHHLSKCQRLAEKVGGGDHQIARVA